MTSGVYRLTFSSGKYYVGKSLDIETRWKQHFNKFALGKAARPMQLEFDRCGPPQTEVLFHCHKDHIDLLEEILIDQLKGPDMLNTTYPEVERTDEIVQLINDSVELLAESTWQHLRIIWALAAREEVLKQERLDAVAEVEDYKTRGIMIPEDYEELKQQIKSLEEDVESLESAAAQHWDELKRYKRMNLWERIFYYTV